MKKLLFILVIILLPLAVSARTTKVKIDGINYLIDSSTKTAKVVTWIGLDNKYSGNIVIPPSVTNYGQDYMVTGMGNGVFESCTELTSVTIPYSIASIGEKVFEGCTGLVSIVVEEGNPTYDSRENCNAIIETASNRLLYGCQSTVIPNTVTTIGSLAFLGYNGPISIVIPDGITSIENEAFKNCDGLTSVTIGNGVTSIGNEAFCNCSNLKTVELNNNVIVSKNYDYETEPTVGAFFGGQVEEYILGKEVKSIGNCAFYWCPMTSLHMSDNVTSIGEKAFCYCSQLTSINLSANLTSIGEYAFQNCQSLTFISIPKNVERIGFWAFGWCFALNKVEINSNAVVSRENEQFYSMPSCFGKQVKKYVLGEEITKIGDFAFYDSNELVSINIPSHVTNVGDSAFYNCGSMTDMYCYAEQVPEVGKDVFVSSNYTNATLHVPATSIDAYGNAEQWKDFGKIVALTAQDDYRPFIEEGKVWSLRVCPDGYGIVRNDTWTEHYYFDGDTIIGGQTCKRMFYITNANEENWVNGVFTPGRHTQQYIGSWYEQDKKVYIAHSNRQQFELIYDFSLSTGDSIQDMAAEDRYWQVTKMSGVIPGFFKGTYYNLSLDGRTERWLEGVGNESWPDVYQPWNLCGGTARLLSCRVGSEIIYCYIAEEDPFVMGARKGRFDFTHTIKTQPKMPRKNGIGDEGLEQSLYGEYSDLQLGIHLDPLDDAYQVSITDESGKVVYGKAVNAGTIMGLNIDISAYPEGRYTVTIENSRESFIGEFENVTTGISDATRLNDKGKMTNDKPIYNLQGQRISSLQKGLNIVDGRKVYVR